MNRLHHISTLGVVGLILAGCPNTIPTAPTIERVELTVGEGASSFTLDIHGRGFALKGVSYRLDDGQGETPTGSVVVQIAHAESGRTYRSKPDDTKLLSPQEVTARFVLQNESLETGTYDLLILLALPDVPEQETVAEKDSAFEVALTPTGPDAGPSDLGPVDVDLGPRPDLGPADAGSDPDGGPSPDADPADGEPLDLADLGPADGGANPDAEPPDNGLGPFIDAYGYRQTVILTNPNASPTPLDVTVRIPVPHADLILAGRAKADASDIAVYDGIMRLEHNFDDRMAVGTNNLALIVRLPFSVATTHTLALYFGDPSVAVPLSDAVYVMVERFDAALPGTWYNAGNWTRNCFGRNVATPSDIALCCQDSTANPTRRTIASPRITGIRDVSNTPIYLSYEISFWLAGRMDEAADLLYFAYSNTTDNFAGAILLPDGLYGAYPPNASTTFQEVNNLGPRTVNGWRMPAGSNLPFTQTVARFVPNIDQPSLHFRFISPNGSNAGATLVGMDDLSVRRVLEPNFGLSLGTVEARP